MKGIFDNFKNADKVLEDFLITARRREDLEEAKITFNDFVHKFNLKHKATSNIQIRQVFGSFGLYNVGIYLRDGPFPSDIGVVSLHPSKGTHWVCSINEIFFDSYGVVCRKKFI